MGDEQKAPRDSKAVFFVLFFYIEVVKYMVAK